MDFPFCPVLRYRCATHLSLLCLFAISLSIPQLAQAQEVSGELKIWHRVGISFDGPQSGETANPNPFTDYRLLVTFSHSASGTTYLIPGFYAADGNAAETGATDGSTWLVYFTPDQEGTWTYSASFRTGSYIAVDLDPNAGSPTSFDGASGSFTVGPTDKPANDFRSKGMLKYVGEHHLQFAGTGDYYVKVGPNSPENMLAYADFDGTYDTNCADEGIDNTIHSYDPHLGDWQNGDPTWQGGKGKGLIGAMNYLSSVGVNNFYFLTYNLDTGDGCDVWPWSNENERERFDVSKLAQWEILFSHMDAKGIQLHVILTERENARKLGPIGGADNNNLNDVRKLYYRELVARFGHHLAVQWNIGEENVNSDTKKIQFADYIRSWDAYEHPITVHTSDSKYDTFYENLYGESSLEATSLQAPIEEFNALALLYRNESAQAGRKWAVYADEQSPNAGNDRSDILREGLWGMLLGGGGGAEWYLSQDLSLENFRLQNVLWEEMGYARTFFDTYLPFGEMEPANERTSEASKYVFAKPNEIYAVYVPAGGATTLSLGSDAQTTFDVRWYNPRAGGTLQTGSVDQVTGGGDRNIGTPPGNNTSDWIALVLTDAPTNEFVYGDVSEDGTVSALDAALLLQHVVGITTLTGTALQAADVSGDGDLSAFDASFILQHAVELISCFPVECPGKN